MRVIPYLLICATSILLAAGCSDDGDPQTGPDAAPGSPDANANEPLINGEPASVFYARFQYESTNTHNQGVAAFPLTDGKNIYVLEFYLQRNGHYIMFYSDGDGEVRANGYSAAIAPEDQLRLEGSWTVAGAKLQLGTLLSCDGLSVDGAPALRCKIVTPPGSSGAPQGTATVKPWGNPTTPTDSRWNDFH
jgi:hypothetical protein